MTRLVFTFLVGLSLISFPSWSADFDKGLSAYKRGDFVTAVREWTPLAEQGDANAQTNLGVMYETGRGVPKDYNEAVRLYRLAAEQGYAIGAV